MLGLAKELLDQHVSDLDFGWKERKSDVEWMAMSSIAAARD
jgi:hypothetical protein